MSFFLFDSFLNSDFFRVKKSTFSSDDLFLCLVCNSSFDQRSKIISNPFSSLQFFKKGYFFCYKIIKVLQLNHSQKIVTFVGWTLLKLLMRAKILPFICVYFYINHLHLSCRDYSVNFGGKY